MQIGIFSDIHLLHWQAAGVRPIKIMDYIMSQLQDCDMIINAGDSEISLRLFFEREMPNTPYIEVMGNHDFYHGPASNLMSDNTKGTITVGGVKFAWATLWTDMDKNPINDVLAYKFTDFHFIDGLTPDIWKNTFNDNLAFLINTEADVVITHHAPFHNSIHKSYFHNPFNPFFVSNLYNELYHFKKLPSLWIHGHVHNKFDYVLNGTDLRVVCNPYGYAFEENWENFQVKKITL